MKPSSAKAKGRDLQKWVRDQILRIYPSLHEDDVRATSMGAGGEDVTLSRAARQRFPYQIECKSVARVSVYKWLEQARAHGPYEP